MFKEGGGVVQGGGKGKIKRGGMLREGGGGPLGLLKKLLDWKKQDWNIKYRLEGREQIMD